MPTAEQVRATDRQHIAEMDMEEAQAEFLQAEKCFREIDADPEKVTDMRLNVRWWNAMERLYRAEVELERLFLGSDRSRASVALYNQYRDRLVKGKRLYRANA